ARSVSSTLSSRCTKERCIANTDPFGRLAVYYGAPAGIKPTAADESGRGHVRAPTPTKTGAKRSMRPRLSTTTRAGFPGGVRGVSRARAMERGRIASAGPIACNRRARIAKASARWHQDPARTIPGRAEVAIDLERLDSLWARLWLAIIVPWKVLFDAAFAGRVEQLRHGPLELPPAAPEPEPEP